MRLDQQRHEEAFALFEEALRITEKCVGLEGQEAQIILSDYEKTKLLLQEREAKPRDKRVPQTAHSTHSVTTHRERLVWLTAVAALLAVAVGSRRT